MHALAAENKFKITTVTPQAFLLSALLWCGLLIATNWMF